MIPCCEWSPAFLISKSINNGHWIASNCKLNVFFFFHPQYSDYEKVVIEDRVAKEQARRKAEQELEELKAATKVRK